MADVHRTAIVEEGAELGVNVEIGPYSVIGPHVEVGEGSHVMSHVVLEGWTTIGRECTVFPFAAVGTQTQDLKYKGAKTFVKIGDGTTLREYVTVNSGTNEGETTSVGSHCHIMAYCHVAHGCHVGDAAIMVNYSALAGHVVVEPQAVLGGLTGVHQFVKIGRLCMVGGFTRVTQDCPPFMLVEGNPAKVRGVNTIGLKRANVHSDAQRLLKEACRILCRRKLSTRQALDVIRRDLETCPEVEALAAFVESSKRGIIK